MVDVPDRVAALRMGKWPPRTDTSAAMTVGGMSANKMSRALVLGVNPYSV
jgi:hypothetical protein